MGRQTFATPNPTYSYSAGPSPPLWLPQKEIFPWSWPPFTLCVHTMVRTPALGLLLLPKVSASILIPQPIESPCLSSLNPWGEAVKTREGLTCSSMLRTVGQNPVSVCPSRVGHQYLPETLGWVDPEGGISFPPGILWGC